MIKSLDSLLSSRTFLKVVSVIVAFLVWYYVAAERTTEVVRTVTLPVEYLNVPADMSISSDIRNVDVQIAAPRDVLSGKSLESIACQVDLKGLETGRHVRPVRAILPSGVRLIDIKPSNIEVRLARTSTKEVPVEIQVKGGLPPGYRLENVRLMPETVVIKGPDSKLEEIERVFLRPTVDELLESESITLRPTWGEKPEDFMDVTVDPAEVQMDYVLVRGIPRKKVPVEITLEGEPHKDYEVQGISVDPPEVVVEAPVDVLDRIREIVLPPVDIEGITEDAVFQVNVPEEGVSGISGIQPSTVRVRVLLSSRQVERMYKDVPIEIRGRSIYPSWRVEPVAAEVLVKGPPSVLDELEENGPPVELFVDVTNIVSRSLRVPLQYTTASRQVKIIRVEPAHVTVFAETE